MKKYCPRIEPGDKPPVGDSEFIWNGVIQVQYFFLVQQTSFWHFWTVFPVPATVSFFISYISEIFFSKACWNFLYWFFKLVSLDDSERQFFSCKNSVRNFAVDCSSLQSYWLGVKVGTTYWVNFLKRFLFPVILILLKGDCVLASF